MSEFTEDRIREIEKRCEDATVGPWAYTYMGEKTNGYVVGTAFDTENDKPLSGRIPDEMLIDEEMIRLDTPVGEKEASTCNYANAEFIASARTDLPDAVTEIQDLRATIEAQAAQIADRDALLVKWAELHCGCENSGSLCGGATDTDPEFTCGYCAELGKLSATDPGSAMKRIEARVLLEAADRVRNEEMDRDGIASKLERMAIEREYRK